MKRMNKFETTSIFLSIAIMALALGILKFRTDTTASTPATTNNDAQGAVVVASQGSAGDVSGVRDALLQSSSLSGDLKNLVVDDVTVGTGPKVKVGDTVTTQYIGTTQDGTQFDNSYVKGQPFTFTVGDGKVIEGWEKGLIGMQVGGKRIIVVPPSMGYGDKQVGPIKPNSVLVFSIELLSIK